MSKKEEAMKLALEALQTAHLAVEDDMLADEIQQAITAIRSALAEQPAQQGCMRCNTPKKCALYGCSPLTWPAEQSAQQEPSMFYKVKMCPRQECASAAKCMSVACSSRAYIKPEQPAQQESVAWKDEQGNVRMTLDAGEIQSSVGYVYSVHGERIKNACIRSDIPNGTLLYISPQPSKPWVGLPKAEIDYQAKKDDHAIYFVLGALWAEAKLREKNT